MEFSSQKYWSGLPFPSPGDLPDPGIEPKSPKLQSDSLPFEHQGSPKHTICSFYLASQVAQWQRIHLSMQETQETLTLSLGWEDHLEKGMATHSGILVWSIPQTEESDGLQSLGSRTVGYD